MLFSMEWEAWFGTMEETGLQHSCVSLSLGCPVQASAPERKLNDAITLTETGKLKQGHAI